MARIVSSLAWSTVFRLVGVGSAFLINVVLARLLAPEDLGQYLIAFSLVMFVAIFMRFGIKQTTMKLTSDARNAGDKVLLRSTLLNVFRYAILTTTVVSVVLFFGVAEWVFLAQFDSPKLAAIAPWIVAWAIAVAFSAPVGEALRALHRPGWGVALDMSAQSAFVLVVAFVASSSAETTDLQSVIKIWLLCSAIVVMAGFFRLNQLVPLFGKQVHVDNALGPVFRAAWPIFALNVARYLTANAALWVVGNMLGHEDAALYGVAIKIFNLLALPLLIMNLGIEPHIADYLHAKKGRRLEALLRLTALGAFAVTLPVSVILVLLGEWILGFAFGEFYSAAYMVLMVLIAGNLTNVLTGSCASVLLLGGGQRALALINGLAALLAIGVSFYFVPLWGILGAGFATVIAVTFANLVMWAVVWTKYELNTAISLNWKHDYQTLKSKAAAQ